MRMWRSFENKWWGRYKNIAAVRGLLQWVGGWGMLTTATVTAGGLIWAHFLKLSASRKLELALAAVCSVTLLFALVLYVYGKLFPAKPSLAPSPLLDRFGRERQSQARPQNTFIPRVIATGLVCLAVAVTVYSGAVERWAASTRSKVDPIIQIDRQVLPLGIDVQPGTEQRIVTFDEHFKVNVEAFHNTDKERFLWPKGIDGISPPQWRSELMARYSVNDRSAFLVFNVRIQFIAFFADDKSQGWKELASVKQEMFADSISPGVPFVFYAVNRSPNMVDFRPSEMVTLQVQGESAIRTVKLDSRNFTMEQMVNRLFPLFPTSYKWKGDGLAIVAGHSK